MLDARGPLLDLLHPDQRVVPGLVPCWDNLVQLARSLGLASQLFYCVDSKGVEIPAGARALLKQNARAGAARAMFQEQELNAVLAAFAVRNIEPMLLKGAWVSRYLYPESGSRTMSDLDILVREEDFAAGKAVLEELGYVSSSCIYDHHSVYLRPGSHYPIELHSRIGPQHLTFCIPVDEVWERSRPIEGLGFPARAMDDEDLFLHLCLHIAWHSFDQRIRPFCDLARLCQSGQRQWNWARMRERAARWNATQPIDLMLVILDRLFHGVVDRPVPVDPALVDLGLELTWQTLTYSQLRQRNLAQPATMLVRLPGVLKPRAHESVGVYCGRVFWHCWAYLASLAEYLRNSGARRQARAKARLEQMLFRWRPEEPVAEESIEASHPVQADCAVMV